MQNKNNYISELISKYLLSQLCEKEEKQLDNWRKNPQNEIIFRKLINSDFQRVLKLNNCSEEEIWANISKRTRKPIYIRPWFKFSAAAALLFAVSSMMFYIISITENNAASAYIPHIPKSQIILTTRTQNITLSEKDTVINHKGRKILVANNSISYNQPKETKNRQAEMHRISVPKGMIYSLNLSDGTKVFLNADTEFSYPSYFAGNTREVRLIKGEAYFEVKKNTEKSFFVHFNKNKVEVTGTKFNIRNYAIQMPAVTLAEGSILVNNTRLVPDRRAQINNGKITIEKLDASIYTAWIGGVFKYRDEKLEVIMDDLSRFYEFKAIFKNEKAKNRIISLKINRRDSLSKIINKLNKLRTIKIETYENSVTIE